MTDSTKSEHDEAADMPAYMSSGDTGWQVMINSSNMICFCRAGAIEYMNAQGIRMLRAETLDNLIGRPFSDLCDDDFGALFDAELDAFVDDDAGVPLKLQTNTGDWIDVTMRVFRVDLAAVDDPVYMIECNDITQYIHTSELTRRREARIAHILQTITEAIITTDETGIIEDFNPAAEKMFGISKQTAVGEPIDILMKVDERKAHQESILRYLQTGQSAILGELREAEATRADGTHFPVEITISEIEEGEGQRMFLGVMRDITDRKRQLEQIEFLAHHDALTSLPNRHLFDDRLQQALIVNARRKSRMALMFIDLDKFKSINDTLGHEAGDIVLKAVAARLLERVRASDTVARVGGDEFVVILDDVGADDNAAQIAQGIIDVLTEPVQAGGEECTVGASIGISMFPEDADTASGLLACADETMYRVKAAGRNNYLFYEKKN